MPLRPIPLLPALCGLVLAACSPSPGKPDAGTAPQVSDCGGCASGERCVPETETCVPDLPSRCVAGTRWSNGTEAFREASAEWGLVPGTAVGTRISVADVDGDGRQDLIIRRAGNDRDTDTSRAVWLLRNTGEGFSDVTLSSGLLQNRTDTGSDRRPAELVVFADVDNDGDVDAFTATSVAGDETPEVMLNDGTGKFTLAPASNDARRAGAWGGASFMDANRDGRVDLFVGGASLNGAPQQDRLYLGAGDGTFTEATAEAGLTTEPWADVAALNEARAHTSSWGTTACDLNGDGMPELLSTSYGRAPNHLWRSVMVQGGVPLFENLSVYSGFAFDHRTDWTDNESARCHCKLNPNDPGCGGVPAPQYISCNTPADVARWSHFNDREPYRLGGNSGSALCADVDADGLLDLLTTEIAHWDVGQSSDPSELLFNTGELLLRFERPGNETTGLTRPLVVPWDKGDITGAIFDFDNDGLPDVYIGSTDYPGTRGWLYQQDAPRFFTPVPLADGIDHKSSHGVGVADFDGDGDLDLVIGHSRNRCSSGDHCYPSGHARFFENVVGQDGNWLQLSLRGGEGSNASAIGAQVTVKANSRTQLQEVGGGHGHYGMQHALPLHFGLGEACEVEVTVRWPDAAGTTETFTLPARYRFALTQGGRPQAIP